MSAIIDKRDLQRRHPLCPSCGYDLIATMAANKRICPECGEAFDTHELRWESRAGDWTLWTALRRGGAVLAARFAIAIVTCIVFSCISIAAYHAQWLGIINLAAALAQAGLLGLICSRRVIDHAGFESLLLMMGACVTALIAAMIGWTIAEAVIALPAAIVAYPHIIISLVGSWTWIIHHMTMDAE